MTGGFARSYVAARSRFRSAAERCGAALSTYVHPSGRASDGSPLSVDVACIGEDGAAALFMTISGTHGVEGLVGSAVQADFLETGARVLPKGVRAVLVHGINPWGFDRLGRTNENNVDLNRNFIDWEAGALPPNEDYAQVHAHIEAFLRQPDAGPGRFSAEGIEAMGRSRFFDAITRGQYGRRDGVMYGGSGPEWSNETLRAIVKDHTSGTQRATVIDWHSGLGERGEPYFLCFSPQGSTAWQRACAAWGEQRVGTANAFGAAETPRYQGLLVKAVERWLAAPDYTGAVIEFGTRPYDEMLDVMVTDLRVRRQDAGPDGAPDARDVVEAFAPADPHWQGKVLAGAREIQAQAVAELSGAAR